MLNRNDVIIRYLICFGCFFLSGSGLITGWLGAISGVIGTIELGTALLRYSPINDIKACLNFKAEPKMIMANTLRRPRLIEH
jgi:hypothetical protein